MACSATLSVRWRDVELSCYLMDYTATVQPRGLVIVTKARGAALRWFIQGLVPACALGF